MHASPHYRPGHTLAPHSSATSHSNTYFPRPRQMHLHLSTHTPFTLSSCTRLQAVPLFSLPAGGSHACSQRELSSANTNFLALQRCSSSGVNDLSAAHHNHLVQAVHRIAHVTTATTRQACQRASNLTVALLGHGLQLLESLHPLLLAATTALQNQLAFLRPQATPASPPSNSPAPTAAHPSHTAPNMRSSPSWLSTKPRQGNSAGPNSNPPNYDRNPTTTTQSTLFITSITTTQERPLTARDPTPPSPTPTTRRPTQTHVVESSSPVPCSPDRQSFSTH